MNKKPIIKAEKLYMTYFAPEPVEILKDLSLEAYEGESVAIMGPSGVGKSTLLHILGTLEKPTKGTLYLFGEKVKPSSASTLRCEKIGFIFQAFHLLEDATVLENVLLPAQIKRTNTRKNSPAYAGALSLLDEVGLSSRIHFPVKHLSGGEKQRVCIARALCNNPDILFADEPSGNLDQKNSSLIHDLLLSLVKKYKKTLIIVTHDQTLASLCDRSYQINNGRLV